MEEDMPAKERRRWRVVYIRQDGREPSCVDYNTREDAELCRDVISAELEGRPTPSMPPFFGITRPGLEDILRVEIHEVHD